MDLKIRLLPEHLEISLFGTVDFLFGTQTPVQKHLTMIDADDWTVRT
jgi:hypothetical protein